MGIMKDNISKVLERGEKLTDLQDKSGQSVHEYLSHGGNLHCDGQNL